MTGGPQRPLAPERRRSASSARRTRGCRPACATGSTGEPEGARDDPRGRRRDQDRVLRRVPLAGRRPDGSRTSPRRRSTRSCATAADLGTWVMSHAHGAEGIKRAVRAGVRSIDHGTYLDDEAAAMMVERGTWLVPTLTAGDTTEELAGRREGPGRRSRRSCAGWAARSSTRSGCAAEAGREGGDGDRLPGRPARRRTSASCGTWRRNGFTPEQALVAATSSAAELMGLQDELGTIEPGQARGPRGLNANYHQLGSSVCVSKTLASSATASSPRWSSAPARWCGAACRASTPSRCSRRCSTTRRAGSSRSAPAEGGHGHAALPRQHQRARDALRDRATARSACSTSRRASPVHERMFRPTAADPHRRAARRARRACASRASRDSAGRKAAPAQRPGLATTSTSRASPRRCASPPTCRSSYLDGQPVRADRAPAPGRSTWGAPDRGAAARRCATASSTRRVRYWQRWVKHCNIPPLYQQRGDPLGARAEAALLRGHRRDRRRHDHLDPRVAGQRPHLGLPLLLAARRLLRARRVPPARPLRGARAVHQVPAQHRGRARPTWRSRRSTASTAARTWRSACSTTGPATTARARCASATARRCTRSTTSSARWCWRSRRCSSTSASAQERSPRALELLERAGAQGDRGGRHARRRHLGVPHRVEAADVLEPDVLGRGRSHGHGRRARTAPAARASSAAPPTRIRDEILAQGLEPASSAASSAATAAATSTRRCCRLAPLRLLPADDPRLQRHHRRDRGRASRATAGCSATSIDDGFGRPDGRVHHLHLLAGRGAGAARPHRRGARGDGAACTPRSRRSACSPRTTRPRNAAHVGQLPAGLLARRPDPRRLRRLAELGRSAMSEPCPACSLGASVLLAP